MSLSATSTHPARGARAAFFPRLGAAILALTAFLLVAAGARDARAADCTECGPVTQDFYFSFSSGPLSGGGSVSGGGMLMAEQQSPGVWLVIGATGGLNYMIASQDQSYSLNLLPRQTLSGPRARLCLTTIIC